MAHVLVADDSPTYRQIVRPLLIGAGHEVSEASDGEAALDALHASEESLVVLLDLVMPKLGGIGVLTAVEASPKLVSRHRFVLVTAHPQAIPPQAVAELLDELDVPVLSKPCPTETLLQAVEVAERKLRSAAG
jgi:CheY-like chemotaxis protein